MILNWSKPIPQTLLDTVYAKTSKYVLQAAKANVIASAQPVKKLAFHLELPMSVGMTARELLLSILGMDMLYHIPQEDWPLNQTMPSD